MEPLAEQDAQQRRLTPRSPLGSLRSSLGFSLCFRPCRSLGLSLGAQPLLALRLQAALLGSSLLGSHLCGDSVGISLELRSRSRALLRLPLRGLPRHQLCMHGHSQHGQF